MPQGYAFLRRMDRNLLACHDDIYVPAQMVRTYNITNGSRIVGWSNPLGLKDPSHRMISSALGVEVLKSHPGSLRAKAYTSLRAAKRFLRAPR